MPRPDNWHHIITAAIERLQAAGVTVWEWPDIDSELLLAVRAEDAITAWDAVDRAAERTTAKGGVV